MKYKHQLPHPGDEPKPRLPYSNFFQHDMSHPASEESADASRRRQLDQDSTKVIPEPLSASETEIMLAFKAGAEYGTKEAFCDQHSCGPDSEDIIQAARRYIGKGT